MADDLVPYRVFVVDDHAVVRAGLRRILDTADNVSWVGEAEGVEGTPELIKEADPDVVLVDVVLPDGNGIELCREVKSSNEDRGVIVLTANATDEALMGAVIAGADGFLVKTTPAAELVEAVATVAEGESLLGADAVQEMRKHFGVDRSRPDLSSLTDREREVLDLVGEGMTNRSIAEQIGLAEKTVRNYVSSILGKLDMARRTEAAALAARLARQRQAQRENT